MRAYMKAYLSVVVREYEGGSLGHIAIAKTRIAEMASDAVHKVVIDSEGLT